MDDSDDYGISDDDSAFLAVATQVEKQKGSFEDSPRPTKQRRVAVDDEIEEVSSPHLRTINKFTTWSTNNQQNDIANTRQATLFKKLAKPKQRVLVPLQQERLPTLVLTQTQVGLDEDPTAIRGPIWKKSRIEQDNMQTETPATTSSSTGRMLPPPKQLQKTSSTTTKPLGLNGNLHNMQRTASVWNRQVIAVDDFEDCSIDIDEAEFDNMTQARPTALQAPKNGLKQMTIFGQPATQPLTSSQAATKKHAWPLKEKEEPKTHHLLDEKALETYTYPTNLGSVRDYQFNIVARSLYHNTLVALPTGLGKTFIAATIMLNYYRWMKEAQIIFMAPTKPLIAQQLEACYGIAGIPRHDTILMTGETTPTIRAEEWKERRVFFMTPQTVINDLKYGRCDPKQVVLLVVDEAHKATGGYAYTEVVAFIRRFNPSFRVLALTATPGSTVEAVQNVIDNLGIARVELRTEDSIDIRQYTHEKQTETELFDWSEEQTIIMDLVGNAIRPVLEKLNSQNAYWTKEPMQLTPYGLQVARQKWSRSDAGRKASMGVKGMINSIFTVLASLAHSLNLLKFHGILPFYNGMQSFQAELAEDQAKRKYARQIAESADFMKSMSYMRRWSSSLDFIGHPKLEYLRQVVMDHFVEAGEGLPNTTPRRATRIMIFSSFRDSTDEICRALKRNEPIVRPHVFVGQSASKNSEGMNQKKQNEIIQDFKNGKYNTLVATSIGEEGLDIGDVDLIICYDASASPIRMLQRIGRTGRKRIGRVVLLLMRGKEERDYAKAQDNYAFIQHSIAQTDKYTYRDDQSLRIIPKDVSPVVDKRVVEIPAENTQPVDLNEKTRRRAGKSKAKKPAKKFFMPDGVQTGFVKASKFGEDNSGEESEKPAKKARKAGPSKAATSKKKVAAPSLPDTASIPFLEDVLLKPEQIRDHERRYARTSDLADDSIISAPAPDEHPDYLRRVQQGTYVRNSRATLSIQRSLKDVHDFDYSKIEKWEKFGTDADLCIDEGIVNRLAEPSSTNALSVDTTAVKQKKMLVGKRKIAPAKPRKTSNATKNKKTARSSNINAYGSDAMEHDESEPEPTPQHLRIATQGIDLGSEDTSGEDEEEEYDSELDHFVVGSDQPIEMLSSSQPGTQYIVNQSSRDPSATQRARELEGMFTSDAAAEDQDRELDGDGDVEVLDRVDGDIDDDVDDDEIDVDEPIIRGKKKRRVLDSDSE